MWRNPDLFANKSLNVINKRGLYDDMRRIPPLAAVRVFEAAARHGNFTRAADELGMTQAAVSYQVKLLEERLHAPLFLRNGRQVSLTPTGRRIAPEISRAFDILDHAFAVARSADEHVLTISCSNTFASNWLAVRLGSFQVRQPGIAVRLNTTDVLADFASDDVDVAIRSSRKPWPGLASHFLMRVVMQPLASPAFLAAHPAPASPDDVLALPRLSPDDVWWDYWYLKSGGKARQAEPATGIRLDSQLLEGAAAIAGQGVAILNPAMWRGAIDAGALVPVFGPVVTARSSYWLVYPDYRRTASKIAAFRQWLFDEMRREQADDRLGIFVPPPDDAA